MIERLKERREPKILVLNKVDLVRKEVLLTLASDLNERIEAEEIFMVSATPATASLIEGDACKAGAGGALAFSRRPGVDAPTG